MAGVDSDLLVHFPLASDTANHATPALRASATDVALGEAGPGGKPATAARFNGESSVIEIGDHESLRFGNRDFSLAAWVRTDRPNADVAGEVMGKYDPRTRRGFNFLILTSDGVTSAAQSNYRQLQFGVDDGRIESAWRDHGRVGNGIKVAALTAARGYLYAGTFEGLPGEVGRLWRFDGGQRWIDLGNPDGCNTIASIAEFDGHVYAGTGRYKAMGSVLGETHNRVPGGRVYRVSDDGEWINCGHPGGADSVPEPMAEGYNTGQADYACGLITYRGRLYCTSLYRKGVFRYEGGTDWSPAGLADLRMMSLTVYRGRLYSLINGGPVYRYEDGDRWTLIGTPTGSTQTYSSVTHRGMLYVGTWPNGDVLRYEGGDRWSRVGRLGWEAEVMGGAHYNGCAYWGSLPMANVYRMDTTGFTLVGNLDAAPIAMKRVWAMATHEGRLYAGTLPGGRVWSIEAGKVATWDETFPDGWHHVAAVRDNGVLRTYVDGKLVASSTRFYSPGLDITNNEPLRVGFGAYEHFDGLMSDVRVYGRSLVASEVAGLATASR